ncbi:MAG: aldehyde dehydrogenase [Methanocorpusculum parvum]|nr:aldehyde dehydrogenase [Methanocorpusculum parvum]
MMFDVRNPATGEHISSLPVFSASDISAAAERAAEAAKAFENTAASVRAVRLVNAAALIRARQDALASLLTREQGKPLAEAKNEIQGAAHVFEYYASVCGSIRGDALNLPNYGYLNVIRKPVGICAAIIPWNMPAIIFAWKAGAALACGNPVLVKPSVTAPLTVQALGHALHEAGIPEDILQIITGNGDETGRALIEEPLVRHVSFTGSTAAGREVGSSAGRNLKRVHLELGGNDAFIVTKSADVKRAAAAAVRHRFYNCGQVCTSAKRILVHEDCEDIFVSAARELIERISVGDGLLGNTMGPLNNADQLRSVSDAVDRIVTHEEGTLVTGGERIDGAGCFYRPTLLRDVVADAVSEEIFGPVMSVIPFRTDDEAVSIANSTKYGLGSSVWTDRLAVAHKYADELKAGVVWVNKHLILPPEMPFGGVSESGFGRENGMDFVYEYTEAKSVLFG